MNKVKKDDNLSSNIDKLKRNGIQVVTSKKEIARLVSEIWDNARDIYTNFYVSDSKQISWIKKNQMFFCGYKSALFIFYARKEYVQLYFCATELPVVEEFLCSKLQLLDLPIIVDVIHRGNDAVFQDLLHILEKNGFYKHISLRRMAKVNKILKDEDISSIDFAQKNDAKEILEILLQNFDVYGEQIPDIEEIEQASVNKDIIVARADDVIAALFWTEHVGQTSHFRYWIARPNYREQGLYGYYVYMQTLSREAKARRMILWVRDNNDGVIESHRLQGFSFDGLVDDIFLRKSKK